MRNLGIIYFNGKGGVEADINKGLEFYVKAAEAGNNVAMNNLGSAYFYGQNGVEVDTNKGLEFYEKAADAGNAMAMNNLGNIYFNGKSGVGVDVNKGLEFYEKAADAGNTAAMNNLGICFYIGESVSQDIEKAIAYFKQSSEKDVNGCANIALSVIYKKAKSFKDIPLSKEYAQKANELIEKMQNKCSAYNAIAWLLYLMHEYKEAFPWIQKLIKEKTTNSNYLDTIAAVYKGLGRYNEALKYYQKALDLGRSQAANDIEDVKKLIADSKKTKASKKTSSPKSAVRKKHKTDNRS